MMIVNHEEREGHEGEARITQPPGNHEKTKLRKHERGPHWARNSKEALGPPGLERTVVVRGNLNDPSHIELEEPVTDIVKGVGSQTHWHQGGNNQPAMTAVDAKIRIECEDRRALANL